MEEKQGIQHWKILFDDDEIIRYWIRDRMSPKKHWIKQQIIPVWNTLTRHNFNSGVFHFGIWWQIDLPEGVFEIINHYGLSVVNQLKKTTIELIFTMRKWVEKISRGCADLANCVYERRLDVGCLVFVKKESYLLLLSDRKVVFGGVFQAFVLGGRRIEPINLVRRQFWFLIFQDIHMMGLFLGLMAV